MKAAHTVLLKVFASQFYKANAAFFLLILGFCFGFMSGVEHKALAQFFTSSWSLLLIPIGIWLLYTIKIVLFNRHVLQQPENEFMFCFSLLPVSQQALVLLNVLSAQMLPALLYAVFLIVVALQSGFGLVILFIIISQLMLLSIAACILLYDFKHPDYEKKTSGIKQLLDRKFSKPYLQFFIEWISRAEPLMLIGTKIFSGLLLYAATRLYQTDVYDWRLLGFMLTISFAGNIMIVFQYHRFENVHFILLRNLPMPVYKRLLNFILVMVIICLPEIGVLVKNFPANLSLITLVTAVVYGLSLLVIIYSLLYKFTVDQDKFTKLIFAMIMILIILILFGVPLWSLAALNVVAGVTLFQKHYYTFEFISTEEGR